MLNLVDAIIELNKKIGQKRMAFNIEIGRMEDAVEYLKELNEACIACNGKGKILRTRSCAEDDRPDPDDPRDWVVCPACHGTGREKKEVK